MKHLGIIFPNQLFEMKYITYDIQNIDYFIITEDPLYFSDKERNLKFNMLKLIFTRATMKYYESYLKSINKKVIYIDWNQNPSHLYATIINKFKSSTIHIMDPVDHLLKTRIMKYTKKYKITPILYETNMFLSSSTHLKEYMDDTTINKKFYQYNFYIWQRHRLNLLLTKDNKPIGKKYSYDKENRKSIPSTNFDTFIKEQKIKYPNESYNNPHYEKAQKYCEDTFKIYYPQNYIPKNIHLYPITHKDTMKHFKLFIKYKLQYFGPYEDAIDFTHISLFHSVITPQLNCGLITPQQLLDYIMKYYNKQTPKQQKHILPSIEGYIRQLNWREYSRLLYMYAYKDMKQNYFNNKQKLNESWYNGTTGILPIDISIKQAFQYGYIHHIQRLMVMCNFMNLCNIDPDYVYKWFMEFSLDSYDWVMINNVYSMGVYADGGLTTTKVYISTGNYINKQSNIPYDNKWEVIWGILYYYFIYRNYKKLKGNGRNSLYCSFWDNYKDKSMVITEGKKIIRMLTN